METISVIALVGHQGVGKSQVTRHLTFNHGFVEIHWSHRWEHELTTKLGLGNRIVCDDHKFVTGVDFIHTFRGAQVWKILKKGKEVTENLNSIVADRTIKNYGSISDLKNAVDSILANYDPSH